MVEVLIFSYNALPMDVVSSYRVKAYCDHLVSFGIRPTLLTHRWEKVNDRFLIHRADDKVIVEENKECTIIRLPYPGKNYSQTSIYTLWSYLHSDLDVGLADSYKIFKDFLWSHLKEKKYKAIIAIYNPHYHLKLAYECWRKFNIPYVLDFRDLWDNEIISKSYRPDFKKRIINSLIRRAWKKWINHGLFFSTTSHKWILYLSRLSGKDGIVVRNGFDYLPSEKKTKSTQPVGKFKIIHFGRIYKDQNLDVFIEGFRSFANSLSSEEVALEIVGLKKVSGVDYREKLENDLGDYVTFVPYMPRQALISYCREQAALFLFPNFREDNGQFAVKVYDYMLMGKNIVVTPGGGEISEVVSRANVGVVLDKPGEVAAYLQRAYDQFKKFASVPFYGDEEIIDQYSREKQVKVMAEKIHDALSSQ